MVQGLLEHLGIVPENSHTFSFVICGIPESAGLKPKTYIVRRTVLARILPD